jgi:hypothetical protein
VVDEEGQLDNDAAEVRREAMEHAGGGADVAAARDRVEETSGEDFKYEDGFTLKTVIGALFVGLIMAPGAIYLGLVAGSGLGSAAQWVTIVLFAEVARRSFIPLKKQEVYILYYVAGGLAAAALGDRGISGGPFGALIWNQYFIQSTQAAPIASQIPHWVVPPNGSYALTHRTFFHPDWAPAIGILFVTQILERVSWIPAGYILFRATSDIERLPFPLASVAASGATALAEASQEDSWRWRVFSTGTVVGLIFGAFYIAIPVLTGVAFGKPLQLFPIPFLDLMSSTERILPAAPVGYSADLGKVLAGFVLPFPMIAGSFVSSVVCQMFLNPIFYHAGMLPHWKPSMDSITTQITNGFDLWISIGIGAQIAIAVIGLYIVIKGGIEASRNLKSESHGAWNEVPKGRGDSPGTVKIAIGVWLLATLAYISLTHYLIPLFPMWLLLTYGLIWTPINSFVAARMFGLTSQDVNFPFLREMTIIESGYKRIDVWYAPMPLHNYGSLAQSFREVELTGTKFTSIIKAELLMMPIILISGLLYWQFIWHTSPIPSPQYPFALKIWPIRATNQAIWNQINQTGGANWVLAAIKPKVILSSGVVTMAIYGVMFLLKAPTLAFYGAVGGAGAFPADTIPTFLGACLGRYYFAKRVGVERWTMYTPVLLAGFACGTGLVSMGSIALALISKAVQPLPF